eukprot:Em0002g336a
MYTASRRTDAGAQYCPLPRYTNLSSSDDISRPVMLKDFVAAYSKSFPLVVRVCEGCWESEEDAISTEDTYILHSIKPIKAVVVQSWVRFSCDKQLIPVNSDIEIGLVADYAQSPLADGQILPTVGDIMATQGLPPVVCATRSFDSGSEDSSVQAWEVIVVRKVKRSVRSFGRRVLKVRSITSDREKTLEQNCAGFFTTDPFKTKLPLSTLLAHARISFPAKARVFPASSKGPNIPPHLYLNIVTLLALVESELVIATCVDESTIPGSRNTSSQYIELPVGLPVSVTLYRGGSRSTEDKRHSSPVRDVASSPDSPYQNVSPDSPYQNVSFNDWEEIENNVSETDAVLKSSKLDSETQPLTTANFRISRTQPLLIRTPLLIGTPAKHLHCPASITLCSDGVSGFRV